jgi:hypothetical protein
MDRAASALAKKRWAKAERTDKVCAHCGRTYRGLAEQVYCSAKHQNAAAAQRLRERRRDGGQALSLRRTAMPSPASPLDRRLELEHARAEAQWARHDGDLAGAARWEQTAARIARDIAGSVE